MKSKSQLGSGHSLTDHLKWMGGLVAHEDSEFRKARHEGFEVVLEIIRCC